MTCKSNEFKKFHRRIRRTLYFANNDCKHPSVMQIIRKSSCCFVDDFTSSEFDKIAVKLSQHGYVSPCNLLAALFYITRLKESNDSDFNSFTPTELFVSSLLLANKYLNDEALNEFVWNSEWATVSGLSLPELNELELRMLISLRWDVSIQLKDLELALFELEKSVANELFVQNGIMSYNELFILSRAKGFHNTIFYLLILLLKCLCALMALYFALLAGLVALDIMVLSRKLDPSEALNIYHLQDGYPYASIFSADIRRVVDCNETQIPTINIPYHSYAIFFPSC